MQHIFFAVIAAVLLSSCSRDKAIPSLRETFSEKDKIPFGTYIARNELQQLYAQNTIRDKKQHFAAVWDQLSDTGSLYVCITKNLFLSKADKVAMLNYAAAGNSLFIACENMDSALLDTLQCVTNISPPYTSSNMFRTMDYTHVEMTDSAYTDKEKYGYYYFRCENAFVKYDSSRTKTLGVNDAGNTNFIVIYYGSGRIYLHCEPRVFGNYFLLQKDNYHYLQNVLAFTPQTPEHVFWDDYYNSHDYRAPDNAGKGLLSVLLQYPSMKWAFWLLLLMALLYILFGGKRRQRIIEVVPPNTNTTVAFAETIGRLYYQEKDNRNIADKMIMYFLEHVRNQYLLNTTQLNNEFIEMLSRKSSVSKEITEELLSTINDIQQNAKVSDQQLLSLNKQIDKFYKNKK